MASKKAFQETSGVDDTDDYKQRNRIEAVLNAREHVLDQRRKAMDMRVTGEIPNQLACRIVREAVEAYILESEHLIQRYVPDEDEEEWNTEEEVARDVWLETQLGSIEMQTHTEEIVGLKEYLDAPDVFVDQWTESSSSAISGTQTTERTAEYQIPMTVSKQAYRELNRFWEEMGMGLEMKHKMPTDSL